jgi:hypothetical protein
MPLLTLKTTPTSPDRAPMKETSSGVPAIPWPSQHLARSGPLKLSHRLPDRKKEERHRDDDVHNQKLGTF